MNHTLLNNQERARQLRIRVENITILLLAVFSFFLFLLTFFPFSRISKAMQGSFEMGRMVQRAFSIVLFVLSLQLWKRKRNAWTIAVGIFVLNFLRGLIGMGHPLHNGIMILDLFLFILFFITRKDFCCPAGRGNRRQTLFLALSTNSAKKPTINQRSRKNVCANPEEAGSRKTASATAKKQ